VEHLNRAGGGVDAQGPDFSDLFHPRVVRRASRDAEINARTRDAMEKQ